MNKTKWKVIGIIGVTLVIIAGLITMFIQRED